MKQLASPVLLIVLASCESLSNLSVSAPRFINLGSKNMPMAYHRRQIDKAHSLKGVDKQKVQPEKEVELTFDSAPKVKKSAIPFFPDVPRTELSNKRTAKTTIYFVPNESDARYGGRKTHCLYIYGESCRKVSASFYEEVKMQGSAILSDGRTINVANKSGTRYKVTTARFGLGNDDNPLVPFRSIAIDKSYYGVNNGDKVFIPATKGMIVPGTNIVHDGYWIVNDVGSAVVGPRIDLFTGTMHWQDFQEYLRSPLNFDGKFLAEGSNKLGDIKQRVSIFI